MSEPGNGFDAPVDVSIGAEKASMVGPAGIDIAYQRLGNSDAPVVLLNHCASFANSPDEVRSRIGSYVPSSPTLRAEVRVVEVPVVVRHGQGHTNAALTSG
jgi:hypothetical protein